MITLPNSVPMTIALDPAPPDDLGVIAPRRLGGRVGALPSFVVAIAIAIAMLASAPAPAFAGGYAFFGGGVGPSFRDLGTGTVQPTLRIGPSVDLGGEAGPFHLSGSADLRFLFGPLDGATAAPVHLDLLGNVGVMIPLPIVQPVFRFRAGPGWEWTPSKADIAVVLGLDLGVRIRAPGAQAALVLSLAPTARVNPTAPEQASLHIELRAGVCFP